MHEAFAIMQKKNCNSIKGKSRENNNKKGVFSSSLSISPPAWEVVKERNEKEDNKKKKKDGETNRRWKRGEHPTKQRR